MRLQKNILVFVLVLAGFGAVLFSVYKAHQGSDHEEKAALQSQKTTEQAPIEKAVVEQKAEKKAEKTSAHPSKKKEPAKYEIFRFDNPSHQSVLNTPTQALKKLPDPEIDAFIKTMHAAMITNIGGGISANQLGKPWQIFLIGPPPMVTSTAPSDLFINPVIVSTSKDRSCFWHGCLSSKGEKFGKVATWNSVTIKAQNATGETFTRELKGLDAIVAQHEFRHLLGGGYHDHAKEFEHEMQLLRLMMQGKLKMIEPCDEKAPFLLDDYQVGESIEEYAARKKDDKHQKPK